MNQKKELLLNQAYQEFIDIGLNIKPIMDELDHLIDLNIMGFGTTEDERIFSRKDFIDLIKRQEEQAIGLKIQHHIEPVHRRVLEGENSAIYVDDLILRITAGSDQVEMKMRFSMVLEYQESRWIVVHWHGSKPEEVKSEEDTWGVENWKQKAEELEKLVAEKTSDLVKKNRDLEIEAALERVRSHSMAMYHSQELEEVVGVTFNQLQSLNLPVDGCQLITFEDQSRDFHFWSATPDMTYPVQINIPYFDNPVFIRFWEAKDGGASFTSFNLTREETLDFYNHVYHHTDLGRTVTKERWKKIQSIEHGFRTSWGIQKNTGLFIFNFDDHIFTPEENSIIDRFAKVFEQAYTRFLDLKKAEAQAREAQIEAALERVRARAMAMHDSSEMLEVADVLFQQIRSLGGELWACGVVICNGDQKDDEVWFANEKGVLPPIAMPHTEEPTHQRMYDGWKNKLDLFTHSAEGEELRKHYEYMLSVDSAKPLFEKIQASGMSFPNWQKWHAAYFSRGYLLIITLEPYEDVSIFTRFAKVFDQAYTRFLDLQKSEAQARESEIQLALERVRARTMAMQHSDELTEASKVLDQQVRALGIDTWGCAFHIYADDPEGDYEWFSSKAGTLPFYKTPRENFFLKFYEKGKAGETFHVEEFLGEACKAHYEYIMTIPVMGDALREVVASGGSLPESQYDHIAFFKHGFLLFITYQPVPEAHDIFQRFAKVFEQTYTRFLDLQKAEAQAREAQIETGLERVRSASLAMHTTADIAKVVFVFFEQLKELKVAFAQAWITILHLEEGYFDTWFSPIEGIYDKPQHFQMPTAPFEKTTIKSWLEGAPFSYLTITDKDELVQFFKACDEMTGSNYFTHSQKTLQLDRLEFLEANHKFGMLSKSHTEPPTKEEEDLLHRFGKVFEQTYTRFLDLQKAETQAREAQIETALERVRSASLAMQNTNELANVVSVLFSQFAELKLEFYQVWINIFILEEGISNCWFSPVEGVIEEPYTAIVPLGPFEDTSIRSWRAGENFSYLSWKGKKEVDKIMQELSRITGHPSFDQIQKKKKMDRMEVLDCNHKYGVLALAKNHDITEEDHSILQRFTKVFEQAYTRFLDLKKAEAQAREAEIQLALERVRARSMAMKSTDELHEVLSVLFRQFDQLGIHPMNVYLSLFDRENRTLTYRASGKSRHRQPQKQVVHVDSMVELQGLYDKFIHDQSDSVEVIFYSKEVLPQVFEIFSETFDAMPEEERMKIEYFPEGGYSMAGYTPFGYLGYDHQRTATEEEKNILSRFCQEFTRVYQRFLDIQKAESQAREAQIEVALERIRSRAMAMHDPEELTEVLALMFDQLSQLGVDALWTHLTLIDLDKNIFTYRMTSRDGKPVHAEQIVQLDAMDSWSHTVETFKSQNPETVTQIHFVPEVLPRVWELFDGIFSSLPKESKMSPEDFPNGIHTTEANCKFGYLGINQSREATDEEKKILGRFGSEFGRLYQRYLDIEKAQKQAREAQIEASLERVRARAMAMHQTDELTDVLCVLFDQFDLLGINPVLTHLTLFDEENETFSIRLTTTADNGVVAEQLIDIHAIEAWKQAFEQWKNCEPNSVNTIDYAPEDLPYLWDLLSEIMAALPEGHKINPTDFPNGLFTTQGHFQFGYLGFNHSRKATEEEKSIVSRFAREFGRTYQRFLDLEKAESQAKEAKIEAALEKVRARTMGMQSSEELPEVANLLFMEVQGLGIPAWSCGYCILLEDRRSSTCIMSSEGTLQKPFLLPHYGEVSFEEWDKFMHSERTFFIQELGGEAIESHYNFMKSLPQLGPVFQELQDAGLSLPTYQINHLCKFSHGFLLFITYEKVPETHDIFQRFTKVFDQTYTRFLDLQKAEAQAREAKIEAALERVRSRTMGMQKAEELGDVATLLFNELNTLVDNLWTCGFVLCEKNRQEDEWWLSATNGLIDPFFLPNVGDYAHESLYQGWEKGESYRTVTLEDQQLQEHYDWLLQIPIAAQIFEEMEGSGISRPNWQRLHAAYFKTGYLVIITEVPCEEEDIFKRFAQVFDLTYTRFLDLKKAENQAREAQIEAALEKVRSRSLAMQDPEELTEVAQLLREEMGILGVEELETSSIYIHDETSNLTQCWFTIKNSQKPARSVSDQMVLDLQDTWVGQQMLKFYRSKEKKASILMKGEQRVEWIRYCESKSELLGKSEFYGETIPERTYHLYKFSDGFLGAASSGSISAESWDLMRRATAVFAFAFTRFQDLQVAQASAKAALRQASLDRVRADISAMRTAADLDKITPLLFKELNAMEIPFIRCGVFIINVKEEIVEAYLSSSEGQSLGALHLPFKSSELTYQTVQAWRKGEVFRQHWDKEDFVSWINQMMEKDLIQDRKTYQGAAAPPESLNLHFVPFTQGMLYVGSKEPLSEDEIDLIRSLSEAFAIAYSRYEDFVKLEQAKAEIESAMTELKATQTQLVQQEKLASLGQLTAGIAHEIKNPLNFVNNFSEVSNELIDEAFEELEKLVDSEEKEEIIAILEDVKGNLSKVQEHGKRANGIVTSMLQHSRGGDGKMEPTDLNALLKEYVNLSFHGMRAGKTPINVDIDLQLEEGISKVNLISEDFSRVIVNLCNNAFDAMRQKTVEVPGSYQPKLTVRTKSEKNQVFIEVEDNGPGIPDEIKDKILQPFFTTKKGTEGTGLGLSITNDIIKAHGGELKIETGFNKGTSFIIKLNT